MDDQRQRMAARAGESGGGKAPKYQVPLIKFNGNTGEYQHVDLEKNVTPLDKTIKVVILKNRKKLEDFDLGLSSNEYASANAKVTLFKNEDGKFSRVGVDTPAALREQNPTIKTQEVLYVLFDGEICKLTVKGGSSSNFYDYKEVLKESDLHSFEVTTVLAQEEAEGKAKKKYFKMTFKNEPLDITLDEVEAKQTEVDTETQKIDDYNMGKVVEYAKEKGEFQDIAALREAHNAKSDSQDDVSADEIPF